jgi:hypothetical protein
MSLTLYTTSALAATVTPAILGGTWSRTSAGIVRKSLVTASPDTLTGFSDSSQCSVHSACLGQWMYGPLAGQVVSGTLQGKIVGRSGIFSNLYIARMAAWIMKPDGTVRAVLLASSNDDTTHTWTTTYGTYTVGAVSLTSQTATAGDYLVLEGGLNDDTFSDCDTGSIRAGNGGTYFILSNALQLFNPASAPSVLWLNKPQPKR